MQSIGQGNGFAPPGFLIHLNNIIKSMKKKGYVAVFRACISLIFFIMVCYAFVDDVKLEDVAEDVNDDGEIQVPRAQASLDQWAGMIEATRGAINPAKSYWYLLDFEWK